MGISVGGLGDSHQIQPEDTVFGEGGSIWSLPENIFNKFAERSAPFVDWWIDDTINRNIGREEAMQIVSRPTIVTDEVAQASVVNDIRNTNSMSINPMYLMVGGGILLLLLLIRR